MRSRKAVVGRVASTLGTLAALLLALLIAVGLGAAAYFFVSPEGVEAGRALLEGYTFLFFILVSAYTMWGVMPLALSGAGVSIRGGCCSTRSLCGSCLSSMR